MGSVFLRLLNMSLTAGWLILAVICFRSLFRKTPKWVNCLMWGVVAVRLICPFSIESTFGFLPGTEPIQDFAVVEGEIQNYIPSINSNLQIVKNSVNPMLAKSFAYERSESVAPLQVATYICGIVWGSGMLLLLLYAVVSLVRLHLQIREAVPYKDNIMICDAVKAPFILGNIRPRIYLSAALNEKETAYIVAHEYAHLKRGDHWWKPIGYLLLCVYWFHPLCWIAYILFCKDIELACDEKVIRDMDIQDKKEYSRTLLSCARQRELVLACPLAFGEVGVKERVKSILNYKKPAFWLILVSIATCAIMAVCFLTTAPRKYQIRVTIPAGGMESFYYSDAEISPKGKHLTLFSGEGLGDTEVILKVVECKQENAYDEPAYLTPGMPVEMDVEKGAWFKIGVSVQNPTEENIDVYVEVGNVDVRIEDRIEDSNSVETLEDGIASPSPDIDIGELLDVICSSPAESSNPGEYVKAHPLEYDTLVSNGEATLRYCIAEFMKGSQTDLRGHIMALACEELLQNKGKLPLDAGTASDGQEWFSTLLAHGSNLVEPYLSPADYHAVFGEPQENAQEAAADTEAFDIGEYAGFELPEGVALGGYSATLYAMWEGCLLTGGFEEPVHGESAPPSWYAPGGIGFVETEYFSECVQFENNILQAVEWNMNHSGRDSEYETIEGCDRQAILCEYFFELFTPPEIQEYEKEHGLEEGELQITSRYWYVFFAEPDSEYVYTIFLNQEYFSKEDTIKMARTLKFKK